MRFGDSTAFVPLLVDEPASESLVRALEDDGGLIVWWGAPVECVSAIARREHDGGLPAAAANAAIARLRAMEPSWTDVTPSARVRGLALRLLGTHPLRASDALELAAALVAAGEDTAALGFVCLDERLTAAGRRESFTVGP